MNIDVWQSRIPSFLEVLSNNDLQELVDFTNTQDKDDPLSQFVTGFILFRCYSQASRFENAQDLGTELLVRSGRAGFFPSDKLVIDDLLDQGHLNPGIYEACGERLYSSGYRGGLFYEGYITERNEFLRDLEHSYRLYLAAAWKKYPAAYYRLGWFYSNGIVVENDEQKAAQYYYVGAKLGDSNACLNFGNRLLSGRGVPQDPLLGMNFLRRGTLARDPHCFNALGEALLEQQFGEYDPKSAYLNFQRGAFHLVENPLIALSLLLRNGEGCAQDLIKAHALMKLAASNQSEFPLSQVKELESLLSPSELQASRDWMREFFSVSVTYQEECALLDLKERLEDAIWVFENQDSIVKHNDAPGDIAERDFVHPDLLAEFPT